MISSSLTKLAILDDENVFLDSLKLYFESVFRSSIQINLFDTSSNFLEFVDENAFLNDSPDEIINSYYKCPITPSSTLNALNDLAKTCCIAIIDQNLGSEKTKGIDIIQKLRNYYPKTRIILLTSVVDDKTAIDLHNNSSIDCFINKEDPNALSKIESFIQEQIDHTSSLLNPDSCEIFSSSEKIQDQTYQNALKKLIDSTRAISHITTSKDGNISILNNNKLTNYIYDDNDREFREL